MKKILLIIVSMLLFSCETTVDKKNSFQSIVIEEEKMEDIKKLVLEEYCKKDSIYFTKKENKIFNLYVNNNFDSIDIYFDIITDGLCIKYLDCYYHEMDFVLIRNNENKYYYLGLTDYEYYRKFIENNYINTSYFYYEFKQDSLIIIDDTKRETDVLYKVFKNSNVFDNISNFPIAFNTIYYTYRAIDRKSDYQDKQYLKEINSFEELVEKLNISEIENPKTYKGLNEFYQNLQEDYDNQKYYFVIYDYNQIGILIFKISYKKIEKLFIPFRKINIQDFIDILY